MRLRLAAGYAALAGALGVACGGRIVGVVQGEGGAPQSATGSPADASSYSDAADQPDATQVVHCCCGKSYDSPWCSTACPCGSDLLDAGALPPVTFGSGEACVTIDVSTYDRSCQAHSDCMSIARTACQNCACTDTAINVDGRDRYNATVAQLPPGSFTDVCHCPNESFPKCVQGVCAVF